MLSKPAPFKEKQGLCATRVDQVSLLFGPGRAITLLRMVQRDRPPAAGPSTAGPSTLPA